MTKKIKKDALRQVAEAAAEALGVVLDEYKRIQKSTDNDSKKIKSFKLKQDASRAALAHVMMLLKVCKDADEKGFGDEDLVDLIRAAEKEIAGNT